MAKLMIICRAFSADFMIYRWQKMAQDYPDMDITLIGPTEYINLDWGKPIVLKVGKNQNERFQFIPLRFVNNKLWRGGYFAKGLGKILKKIKPDLISEKKK